MKLESRFAQMETRFAEVDVKVQRRFSDLESRLVTMMFTFWAGTVATLGAIMYTMLRAHS